MAEQTNEQIAQTLVFPYLNHAVKFLQDEYATATDIDNGMRFGCGYPVGPLAYLDSVGPAVVRDALAARLAAARRYLIDPHLLESGRRAARGRDVMAMIDADLAFHSAIYVASENPLIEESAALHWRHLRRVMGAVLQLSGQREAVWDEHEAIAEATERADLVYVSVDVDVVDPGMAPGTGTPEPGGLLTRELLRSVRRIARAVPLAGLDVMEVSPPYDHADMTAVAGATIAMYVLGLLAEKKTR